MTLPNRIGRSARPFITNRAEIIAVLIFRQSVDDLFEVGLANETHSQRDFFEARDLQALSVLDGGDVIAGLKERRCGSGIKPRHTAAEEFHVQLVPLQIQQIQIGNFQFAAR